MGDLFSTSNPPDNSWNQNEKNMQHWCLEAAAEEEEEELDIAQVDASEQQRILASIRVATYKATIGGAKRQRTEGKGGLRGQAQRAGSSIAAFFRRTKQ